MRSLELLITQDVSNRGVAVCLKPNLPQVLTPTVVQEIRKFQNSLASKYFSSPWEGCFYVIWYSHKDHGAYGRGLDFNFIEEALHEHHEQQIESYVASLMDLLFLNYINLGLPLVNCSLVDRTVTGISQEFFYLNKINFIKRLNANRSTEPVCPVALETIAKQLVFPPTIYQTNAYYQCSSFDLSVMKHYIENFEAEQIGEESLQQIRSLFDNFQKVMLHKIYQLASEKPGVLHRMAKLQRRI